MTFILRAMLVIGALTYFAAQRQGALPLDTAVRSDPKGIDLAAAWTALPVATRDRIAREGAAGLSQRLAAAQPSQDTLAESDRRPAWRGMAAR